MLETKYKSPWRKLLIEAVNPTVRQVLAAAGGNPATLGYAVGSGGSAGSARIGGAAASCLPWGAAAVAVSRLELSEGRILAVLAKGAVNNLPVPGPEIYTEHYTAGSPGKGSYRTGAYGTKEFRNPFSKPAMVRLVGSSDDGMHINGAWDGYPTPHSWDYSFPIGPNGTFTAGAWNVRPLSTSPVDDYWGINMTVSISTGHYEDAAQVAAKNAESAIPALDSTAILIYGNTVPWWPAGEAFARAGTWMRRRSWTDEQRRMRFEAGGGTTAAVAVMLDSDRAIHDAMKNVDFTAEEFMADDWEAYDVLKSETVIDVTDLRFESAPGGGGGFFFAVDYAVAVGPEPTTAEIPLPPASGDYVCMSRNGSTIWAPVQPFACPL